MKIFVGTETFELVKMNTNSVGTIQLVDPNRREHITLCARGLTYGRVLFAVDENFKETVRVWIMHRRKNLSR